MTYFYLQHPNQQWHSQCSHHYGQTRESVQQQEYTEPSPMPNLAHMYRQLMIEEAIMIAREQVPGQVIKAELDRSGGRLIYEVEIVYQQGVKYEVKIDATTGEVIEVKLD